MLELKWRARITFKVDGVVRVRSKKATATKVGDVLNTDGDVIGWRYSVRAEFADMPECDVIDAESRCLDLRRSWKCPSGFPHHIRAGESVTVDQRVESVWE